MALPYATEDQLKKVKKELEKKINAGGGASGEIPTKLSQLTNDIGFITTAALTDYALKSELPDVDLFVKEADLPDFATFALKTDLPDFDTFALKTEIPVGGVNYFALTDISDADHSNRHSMMMKNDDSVSGYALKDNQSYNLVMVNKWDVADFGSRGLPINLNGSKERPTYNDDKEIALVEDLEWLPVICNMNFRNLADKVYSQEEIFAWFFVEDVVGLKNLVLKHPVYLRFGISLSGNPKYYYIPCQYVAFIDANTVEMITDGLDTRNDKFSRYHITIKLDGTVINGASNIKVELKENVFVPDLPEDADTKTYQLKAVNGTLTWIE